MPMRDMEPPNNIEAEQAVLGAIYIKPELINPISEILEPNDFYRGSHKDIFSAMLELSRRNEPISIITVTDFLDKKNILDRAGGISYVTGLTNAVPTAANAESHAKIVKNKSRLRQLIKKATDIVSSAYEQKDDAEEIIDASEKSILELSMNRGSSDFDDIHELTGKALDMMNRLYDSEDGILGIETGFRDLDQILSGLNETDFIILAARPSMGKSAFAVNIMANAALRNHLSVAFFSLEMSSAQLSLRMLCSEAGVAHNRIRDKKMPQEKWSRIINISDQINNAPIYISNRNISSIMEIRSKCRRLKQEHGLDLVIIDYLQLMGGSLQRTKPGHEAENRQLEVSGISRGLKNMATELEVPVIALSQLSRAVESRQVKRPMLSDLRESGSLEQDADVVIFLYREEYYNPKTEKKGEAEVIVGKNRNGPTGTVLMQYQSEYTRFLDMKKL